MLLDKNLILYIGKERIKHYKNIDLESLPNELQDPWLNWIQSDPDLNKEKYFFQELLRRADEICSKQSIAEQKKTTKTIILNYLLNTASLYFVLLYPKDYDLNNLQFAPVSNATEDQLNKYLTHLSTYDPYFKSKGITDKKTVENAAYLIQEYSVSNLLYLTLENCILNIGVGNINEKIKSIRKNMVDDILAKIKNNNSTFNDLKTSVRVNLEKNFIEED